MRLIFSTILAAALVFGGTLLFAGYFEGVEVPRDEQPERSARQSLDTDTRTLWHCPAVERILTGSIPEIFEVSEEDLALFREGAWVSVEDLTYFEKGTEWDGVSLGYLFEVGDRRVKGKTISCSYRNWDRSESMKLTLISDLYGEIMLDPRAEGGWHRVIGTDCAAPAFGCRGSLQECGFYVHQADIRIREMKTRDDEPCLWPPLDHPEIPVERGGRATGSGD